MPLGFLGLPAVLLLLAAGPAGDDVYSWTDAEGVAHYTNDVSTIPLRYRDQARSLDGQRLPVGNGSEKAPPAETKPSALDESPKAVSAKPAIAAPADEAAEESAPPPPPLTPSAAEKLDEAGWRKRFQSCNERVRRAELALSRSKEQLSRVANEEGYMVVDAYGRTMTAGRSTALKMQVAEDERVLNEAREALHDLERAAAREAIPFEWRR
jgi:hypothetical protein